MVEFGENDTFKLDEDRMVILTPGFPPPQKSLKDKVRTGEALGKILEDHLMQILGLGEAALPTSRKRDRRSRELGGRRFIDNSY